MIALKVAVIMGILLVGAFAVYALIRNGRRW